MEGLARSLLVGGAGCLAIIAIGFFLFPEFFGLTTIGAWVIAACAALASAMAMWTATRLSATSSWLIAIVGWIVGFNLVPVIVGPLFQIIASSR